MKRSEAANGNASIYEGGNNVLLNAIAHPALFEEQCNSIDDVRRAFRQRGFSTEGSSSMTLYGGNGKYHTGTADCCFVRCGKQLCCVKTSLSTRPEAEVTLLAEDGDHLTDADITMLRGYFYLHKNAPRGPQFEAAVRKLKPATEADTLVTRRVDETLSGSEGTRTILSRFFKRNT